MKTSLPLFFVCLLLLVLPATGLRAQKASIIAHAVQQQSLTDGAISYNLFTPSTERDSHIDAAVKNVVYLKLNRQALKELRHANAPLLAFSLPLGAGGQNLTLKSYNILDDGFKVYERGADNQKKEVQVETGIFYRGVLEDKFNSLAAFTFTKDEVAAVFSTLDGGNYNLVLNYEHPGADRDNYILFREGDVRKPKSFHCGITADMDKPIDMGTSTDARGTYNSCHKLRTSLTGDYLLYQKKNGDLTACVNYLTTLLNADATIYNNEGINLVLSEIIVDSAPDGYIYDGIFSVIARFAEEIHNSFNGDLAQIVSGFNQNGVPPLGGTSYIDKICQPPVYALQEYNNVMAWEGPFTAVDNYILDDIPAVPVYSWDVQASTHEIGHNIGSYHTHNCGWPGGAIDGCFPTEGGCPPGPMPPPNGGTIMSYCHFDTAIGINFAMGFGPLPGNLIRNRVAIRSCLTSAQPVKTLSDAETVRTANRQCTDGDWTYFYYDNNTSIVTDDELLLGINTHGQDIGNIDMAGVRIEMTTTQNYGTNTANPTTYSYAPPDWKGINRSWQIRLPALLQPVAPVTVRFPFDHQDVSDINGSEPAVANADQLMAVSFKNEATANEPFLGSPLDIDFYTHATAADALHWSLGTTGNYNYAEFVCTDGVFGGTMGFSAKATGVGNLQGNNTLLSVYPNPATGLLNIRIPETVKSAKHTVALFDNLGRSLISKTDAVAKGGVLQLDVSQLAAGVYSVRYINDGASFNALFVKK